MHELLETIAVLIISILISLACEERERDIYNTDILSKWMTLYQSGIFKLGGKKDIFIKVIYLSLRVKKKLVFWTIPVFVQNKLHELWTHMMINTRVYFGLWTK